MQLILDSPKVAAPKACHAIALLALVSLFPAAKSTLAQGTRIDDVRAHTIQSIEELRHDDFLVRKLAIERLSDDRLKVFDELYAARNTEDLSQNVAIERLIKQARKLWPRRYTNSEIEALVRSFPSLDPDQQAACIRQLGLLETEDAALALIDICRYEPETQSLLATEQLLRCTGTQSLRSGTYSDLCRELIVNSQLPPTRFSHRWLLAAAQSNSAAETWRSLCAEAIEIRKSRQDCHPIESHSYLNLVQWVLDHHFRRDDLTHEQETMFTEIETQFLSLVAQRDVCSILIWLERLNRHASIDRLCQIHTDFINSNPIALVAVANSKQATGEIEAVNKLLNDAERAIGEHPIHFLQTAVALYELGFEQSAFRFLEQAIVRADSTSIPGIQASLTLAHYSAQAKDYHQSHLQLKRVYDLIIDSPSMQKSVLRSCGYTTDQLLARSTYALAVSKRDRLSAPEYFGLLIDASNLDSQNTDVLIALDRHADQQPAFRTLVDELIGATLRELDRENAQVAVALENCDQSKRKKSLESRLATTLNRAAWLRVRTNRQPKQAETDAQQAISIRPEITAYLDTMACCQFANGKPELAIQTALHVARLKPNEPLYQQRLAKFQRSIQGQVLASLPVTIMK